MIPTRPTPLPVMPGLEPLPRDSTTSLTAPLKPEDSSKLLATLPTILSPSTLITSAKPNLLSLFLERLPQCHHPSTSSELAKSKVLPAPNGVSRPPGNPLRLSWPDLPPLLPLLLPSTEQLVIVN